MSMYPEFSKSPSYMIKVPVQRRSRETVASIIEACSRLLIAMPYTDITTDRIAEVAGVSIGSLYQFFSNKESIVAAVIDHLLEEDVMFLQLNAAPLLAAPLEQRVENFIELGFQRFQNKKNLRVALHNLQGILNYWDSKNIFFETYKNVVVNFLPELPGRDRNLVGLFLVAAFQNTMNSMLSGTPTAEKEAEVKKELNFMIKGYLKEIV